jgi:hypothetical protein
MKIPVSLNTMPSGTHPSGIRISIKLLLDIGERPDLVTLIDEETIVVGDDALRDEEGDIAVIMWIQIQDSDSDSPLRHENAVHGRVGFADEGIYIC